MAYSLFRVRELKMGDISSTDIHNARRYDEYGIERPNNLNPEQESFWGHNMYDTNQEPGDPVEYLDKVVKDKLEETKVKIRKNSNVAIEIVVGINGHDSEEFYKKYSCSGFFSRTREFIAKEFGGYDNIIAQYDHYDESKPHAHFIVTPIVEKEVKWKNRNGEGVKKENRLSARDFTGNKDKLRRLQDEFHDFCKPFLDRYDLKLIRGTLSEEQTRSYTQHTNRKIGDLRKELYQLDKEYKELEKAAYDGSKSLDEIIEKRKELEQQQKEKKQDISELNEELNVKLSDQQKKDDIRSKKNRGSGWKKGNDFPKGF